MHPNKKQAASPFENERPLTKYRQLTLNRATKALEVREPQSMQGRQVKTQWLLENVKVFQTCQDYCRKNSDAKGKDKLSPDSFRLWFNTTIMPLVRQQSSDAYRRQELSLLHQECPGRMY